MSIVNKILTNGKNLRLNVHMKPQGLTSFDIYFMAAELNNTLASKIIKSITKRAGDIYFSVGKRSIRFTVMSGTPYIMWSDNLPVGRGWLEPIKGGTIEKVEQVKTDRIIRFKIYRFDRLGKRKDYAIYVELFKNGNVLLTDSDDRILASYRKITNLDNKYKIEKPQGFNILTISRNEILGAAAIDDIKRLKIFQYSAAIDNEGVKLKKLILDTVKQPEPHLIYKGKNDLFGFAVYGPPYTDGFYGEPGPSIMDVVSRYVNHLEKIKTTRPVDHSKEIKKAEKKLKALSDELAGTEEYKRLRMYGELILANLNKISKGQQECVLDNPYALNDSDKTMVIPLDRSVSPERNAARCFEKARKLQTAIPIIKKRLEKQKRELERLKKLDATAGDYDQIAKEKAYASKSPRQKIPFRQYDLDKGWKIYAGKSAKSNDELTFDFARKDDLWFHAWQAFGSHIILRGPARGAEADRDLLIKAASIAAYFSKAKTSGKVPVIYTKVRYVRKVKKVPGKVTYSNEKELIVEPLSPAKVLHHK